MNKRIDQLYRQSIGSSAKVFVPVVYPVISTGNTGNSSEAENTPETGMPEEKKVFDYRLFARLIIEDCMKVCDMELSKGMLPSDHVREHFGIE